MNPKDINSFTKSMQALVNKMQKDLQDTLVNLPEEEKKKYVFDFAELQKEGEAKAKELISLTEILKTKLKTI